MISAFVHDHDRRCGRIPVALPLVEALKGATVGAEEVRGSRPEPDRIAFARARRKHAPHVDDLPRAAERGPGRHDGSAAHGMNGPLSWDGVDWFGCDDDLLWEPLTRTPGTAARPARRRRRPSQSSAPLRRVLLLDVENVCPSSRRPVRALRSLRAVLKAAGPVDQVIAASAASQHARLDRLLQLAGVQTHTRCANGPDAADRALIAAARRFARSGDCEVVVASNDHCFSVLAGLPGVRRLVLVTHPHLDTARSLARAAHELRVTA
jgi:hypothetical protein